MIFEYALEPELVAGWHDWQSTRYFKEKFGVGRGRLVSRYPRRWQALVWQAFHSTDQNSKKRLEGLLALLTRTMIARGSSYDGTRSWLENAEKEHERSPFHAILARTNPRGNTSVVLGDTVDEETEPRWEARISRSVGRDPVRLAEVVAPILRCCSAVVFVDPYFAPHEARFRRTLEAFLAVMVKDRPLPLPTRIELHVNHETYGLGYFKQQCEDKLPEVIPAGLAVRVIRWKQRPGSQELHNRYILTDIGGVSFGHGLDESNEARSPADDPSSTSGDCGPSDDVKRFEFDDYLRRWRQYVDEPEFNLDGEPIVIAGTGTSTR